MRDVDANFVSYALVHKESAVQDLSDRLHP